MRVEEDKREPTVLRMGLGVGVGVCPMVGMMEDSESNMVSEAKFPPTVVDLK